MGDLTSQNHPHPSVVRRNPSYMVLLAAGVVISIPSEITMTEIYDSIVHDIPARPLLATQRLERLRHDQNPVDLLRTASVAALTTQLQLFNCQPPKLPA